MLKSAASRSWTGQALGSLSWGLVATAAGATVAAYSVAFALAIWPPDESAELHGGAPRSRQAGALTLAGLNNRQNTCFFNALLQVRAVL